MEKHFLNLSLADERLNGEPGEEVAPSGGGIEGELQRLNSHTGGAGGPGGTSCGQRPERPE